MKITILGGGVIGVTTAWYLSNAGHQVTLVERQHAVAEETSHANAGQISYGYSSPWAAPGVPQKAIKWLLQSHAPLKISPSLDPAQWQWMMQMLVNCGEDHYQRNKRRMLRVANHSRACLAELTACTSLEFEGRRRGTLQLFRHAAQLTASRRDAELLADSGIRHQLLDIDQCIATEPALAAVRDKFVGGLRLPDDETGDCYRFTHALATRLQQQGVELLFNTEIERLVEQNGRIHAVQTNRGLLKSDHYVVALGSYSAALLAPLGLQLPIYPVKGYSLTVPVIDDDKAPVSTVMDETYKVALTRFDQRIRVAGTAELNGFNLDIPRRREATLAKVLGDLFPAGGDLSRAEYWTGLRPMTPDGTPIIGETPFDNLYTNTGHGTLGWTMACGSAQLLADIIEQRPTAIDSSDLGIARYAS